MANRYSDFEEKWKCSVWLGWKTFSTKEQITGYVEQQEFPDGRAVQSAFQANYRIDDLDNMFVDCVFGDGFISSLTEKVTWGRSYKTAVETLANQYYQSRVNYISAVPPPNYPLPELWQQDNRYIKCMVVLFDFNYDKVLQLYPQQTRKADNLIYFGAFDYNMD